MRAYLSLIRQAWEAFGERRCGDLAATMGLHLTMGLTALTIVLAWLAGVTGLQGGPISAYVHELIGVNAGGVFDSLLEHASTSWRAWVPVMGVFVVFVWNVVSLMRHVQNAINASVGVELDQKKRHWAQVAGKRLAGTAFVAVAGLGLAASFSAKTALEVFDYLGIAPVAQSPWAYRAGEVVLALLLATILFAGIFRLLPDAKLRFGLIWHGAFWAAKLYTVVQIIAAFAIVYVGGLSYYGEAAVLLVLLGYLYFACVSFLWGAQVLRVDIERHGVTPRPSKWAVRANEGNESDDEGSQGEATCEPHAAE
jgi:membrane protein